MNYEASDYVIYAFIPHVFLKFNLRPYAMYYSFTVVFLLFYLSHWVGCIAVNDFFGDEQMLEFFL